MIPHNEGVVIQLKIQISLCLFCIGGDRICWGDVKEAMSTIRSTSRECRVTPCFRAKRGTRSAMPLTSTHDTLIFELGLDFRGAKPEVP